MDFISASLIHPSKRDGKKCYYCDTHKSIKYQLDFDAGSFYLCNKCFEHKEKVIKSITSQRAFIKYFIKES